GLDAQRQPSQAEGRIYEEGRAVRGRKADGDAARLEDDVLEHARTSPSDLPDIGGIGDGAAGSIVGLGHPDDGAIRSERHLQELTFGRRGVRGIGDEVVDRQLAYRLVVEPGHQDDSARQALRRQGGRIGGELQALYVGETVDPVPANDIVGHGDDVVAEVERGAVV